jgi:hypothetical protein
MARLLTRTLYGIASEKHDKRAPCKDTATAFVSDQEAEAAMLYCVKVMGSVLVQDQVVAAAGIVERRLLSLPLNSVKFASARLIYSNHCKITHRCGLFLLRIKRKQIGDLLL